MITNSVSATCQPPEISVAGFGSSDGNMTIDSRQIATITVDCDGEYWLGLDAGHQPFGTRRMNDGTGHFISYYLWQESGHSQEWGDRGLITTTYPALPVKATGEGNPTVYTVFGSTVDQETAVLGQYSDTVQVILAYPPYGTADQQTALLSVSLHKIGHCTIDAGGIGGFGTRPIGLSDLSGVALGAFSVHCNAGIHYGIGIDAGQYFNGGKRHLSDSIHYIPYTLWANQAATQEWGDQGLTAIEPDYTETYPAPAQFNEGTGSPQAIFLWGDVALKSSQAPMGIYQDSVMVTIVW